MIIEVIVILTAFAAQSRQFDPRAYSTLTHWSTISDTEDIFQPFAAAERTEKRASRWATVRVAACDGECGRVRRVALVSSAAQKYREMTFKFKINTDMDSLLWMEWGGGVGVPHAIKSARHADESFGEGSFLSSSSR